MSCERRKEGRKEGRRKGRKKERKEGRKEGRKEERKHRKKERKVLCGPEKVVVWDASESTQPLMLVSLAFHPLT